MTAAKFRIGDIVIAVIVVAVVLMLIISLTPTMLDIMIVINIAVSITILLIALNTGEVLDFSTFPSLLLIMTIFRMALNISSTRMILGNGGYAGKMVSTFGNYVGGGDLVVGAVIFIILVLAQFLVITKGAERVAEVAARFTLDAMPGKQMAIDADLNSGVIDEAAARKRRTAVAREADFYGSMDGASKFVKGDNILGIIVTGVNIVGGLIIGSMTGVTDPVRTYVIAAIGDGLCAQIPSLLISTATGIIVTRAASDNTMGTDVSRQITQQPPVMIIAGAVLAAITIIPGMPWYATLPIGGALIAMGLILRGRQKKQDVVEDVEEVEQQAQETRKPENVVSLLQVDPIELFFGYGIIPLAETSQGGDLLDRVVMIRRQCALELGLIVPIIRLRDNIQLAANEYSIAIKGNEVAHGEIMLDHYLAMNPGDISEEIDGIETVEPAFGLPARWISGKQREKAEMLGYTIVDPPSVIATHLTEVVRRHAYELLGRQQVQVLADNLRQNQPSLVDEVIPKVFSLGDIQRVLSNLLHEGVSIRDMATIVETMSDYSGVTRDPDMLTEYVRQALRRTISSKFIQGGKAHVITLDPEVEQLMTDNMRQTEHGTFVALEADTMQKIFGSLRKAIERVSSLGMAPLVMTGPIVRPHFKHMVEQLAPNLTVLSYNEVEQDIDIQAEGMVTL